MIDSNGDRMDHNNGDSLYDIEENVKIGVPIRFIEGGTNLIIAIDIPGGGGANHSYAIRFDPVASKFGYINFQDGPFKESTYNGCTNEDLLAIVKDRLECFQAGPFPCEENARALKKVQEALDWLNYRTTERVKRGVEGKDER